MSNEEFIQSQIESGKSDESMDGRAYQRVFNALQKKPASILTNAFADNIISVLQKRSKAKLSAWEIGLTVGGGVFSIITFILAIVLTNFRVNFGFLQSINNFKGVFIFGLVFIVVLQWIDKVLVRKKDIV
jgi:hypothetical protein